jgi:hypothetical protein
MGVTEISFLRTAAALVIVTLRHHRRRDLGHSGCSARVCTVFMAGLREPVNPAVNHALPRPVLYTGCKGEGSFPIRISGHPCE